MGSRSSHFSEVRCAHCLTVLGDTNAAMGRATGKLNQEYSEDLAVVTKRSRGNHKILLKAIWKSATANNLKELFGKDEIRPTQDMKILKKAGHIKAKEVA